MRVLALAIAACTVVSSSRVPAAVAAKQYVCDSCGHVFDPKVDGPLGCKAAIPPCVAKVGTPFEQLPDGWVCPQCGAPMADYGPKVLASGETVWVHKHAEPHTASQASALASAEERRIELIGGTYHDPNHYQPTFDTFNGWRMISANVGDKPNEKGFTLVGTDDGRAWWTLEGKWKPGTEDKCEFEVSCCWRCWCWCCWSWC